MYACNECGAVCEDEDVEDSSGMQVVFDCSNGCKDSLERVEEEEEELG